MPTTTGRSTTPVMKGEEESLNPWQLFPTFSHGENQIFNKILCYWNSRSTRAWRCFHHSLPHNSKKIKWNLDCPNAAARSWALKSSLESWNLRSKSWIFQQFRCWDAFTQHCAVVSLRELPDRQGTIWGKSIITNSFVTWHKKIIF